MMRKEIKYLAWVSVLVLLIACKPETKDIGTAYAAGDGIVGSWMLSEVIQTDLSIPVPEEMDITHYYDASPSKWEITFKEDSSYTVDSKGPGPDIFGSQGSWKFDQYPFPRVLIMGDTDSTMVSNDLSNMPRLNDAEFGFEFIRNGCDKDIVKYSYKFRRK